MRNLLAGRERRELGVGEERAIEHGGRNLQLHVAAHHVHGDESIQRAALLRSVCCARSHVADLRGACLAAAAVFALSAVPIERAAAMSPINPGIAPAAQSAMDDLTIQVRGGGHGGGGHGGGHVGGGHFGGHIGGGHFGGGHFGGGGWHGGGWHGARVAHFGGFHRGFHHRRFVHGGYYPYYYYPYYPYPVPPPVWSTPPAGYTGPPSVNFGYGG